MTDIYQMRDFLNELTDSSPQAGEAPYTHIPILLRKCVKYHSLMVQIDGADEANWSFPQKVEERELREHITAIAARLGCVGVVFDEDFRGCIVSVLLKSGRTNKVDNNGWEVPYQ